MMTPHAPPLHRFPAHGALSAIGCSAIHLQPVSCGCASSAAAASNHCYERGRVLLADRSLCRRRCRAAGAIPVNQLRKTLHDPACSDFVPFQMGMFMRPGMFMTTWRRVTNGRLTASPRRRVLPPQEDVRKQKPPGSRAGWADDASRAADASGTGGGSTGSMSNSVMQTCRFHVNTPELFLKLGTAAAWRCHLGASRHGCKLMASKPQCLFHTAVAAKAAEVWA